MHSVFLWLLLNHALVVLPYHFTLFAEYFNNTTPINQYISIACYQALDLLEYTILFVVIALRLLIEQDQDLDHIYNSVLRQKQMGYQISDELDEQNGMVWYGIVESEYLNENLK